MECDYCGADVDDEAAYRRHLRAAHDAEELSPIDRRRLEQSTPDAGGVPRRRLLGGLAVVGLAGAATFVALRDGDDPPEGLGPESEPLPESGDGTLLEGQEFHEAGSREHVSPGADIEFNSDPPSGGPHYDATAAAGFYEETPPLGEIVHTLEHGAVVDYYDPERLTDDARRSLRAWAANYTGTWSSFLAVPTPVETPDSPHVLAAWEYLLRLDEYDVEVVRAFVAEHIGRGPENAVR